MFYITGDTHGDFSRFERFSLLAEPTKSDVMIILGDVGLNFYGAERDRLRKQYASSFDLTFFCIHGNHEMRPADVGTYKETTFCSGTVWFEEDFPNLLFAKDGEIYKLGDYKCIVIGGAYSVDKHYRQMRGYPWFENEQPSDEIKS